MGEENTNRAANEEQISLINIEKTLNRPIAKFYNGDDSNVTAAELRLAEFLLQQHNLL